MPWPEEAFSTKHLRVACPKIKLKEKTEKKQQQQKLRKRKKQKNDPKDPKVRHIISYLLAHKVPKIMAKGNWNRRRRRRETRCDAKRRDALRCAALRRQPDRLSARQCQRARRDETRRDDGASVATWGTGTGVTTNSQ